jgi:hypothetical protein
LTRGIRITQPWTLQHYEPVQKPEENLRTVEGDIRIPGGILLRKMTVIRLSDGRLVIHSAIALDETDMHDIERWGEPAFCIVPNRRHRLDAPAFKQRYPKLKILCPLAIRKQVERVVAVDGDYELLPKGLQWRTLALKGDEAVFIIFSGENTTLLFADALFNLARIPGALGALLRFLGSTGGLRVTPLTKLVVVNNRKLLAEQYRQLAGIAGLVRLIPGHGANIEDDAPAVLREVAARI